MKPIPRVKRFAFTMIELVLVVSVIAVLAGVLIPIIQTSLNDAKVARMCAIAEGLKVACRNFYFDTGSYAQELSWDASWSQLSKNIPPMTNWNGPYYAPSQTTAVDLPFGVLRNSPEVVRFDIDGDGAVDRQGALNAFVVLWVPRSMGFEINNMLDSAVAGNWKETGMVEYVDALLLINKKVYIYIIGGTGG